MAAGHDGLLMWTSAVRKVAGAITPVPGGVGAMPTACAHVLPEPEGTLA